MLIVKDTDYHLHISINWLYRKYQSLALKKDFNQLNEFNANNFSDKAI